MRENATVDVETYPQAFHGAEELYLIGGVYRDTKNPGRITT